MARLIPARPPSDYWPTSGWRTSTPEQQGFDSVRLAAVLQRLSERRLGLNSLLVVRNGYVILDAYLDPYDGSFPHRLASVTKSVTATLVGIAIDQGKLQLDQPMASFFLDRTIANLDDRKKAVTVRHLVAMMNGMESGCLSGDGPTLDAMRSTPDWVQAALDRRMVMDPGTRFCYDSPGMHLLSAILQKVTGLTELEFARQSLFASLGIRDVLWESDPQGHSDGWGNMHMKPRDAAKLGWLWMNQGRWEEGQIVSAGWMADMLTPHSDAGEDTYGYGIWVARLAPPNDNFFAVGRGGQFIRAYPSYNLVLVITAQGLAGYQEVGPAVLSARLSLHEPLPPDPAASARLNAIVTALAKAAQAYPVAPLPDTARAISGRTLLFGPNPLDAQSLRFDFSDATQAALHILHPTGDEHIWSTGLDGRYRFSPAAESARGYWADAQTFIISVFGERLVIYQFRFDGERVEVSSPELGV